MKTILILAAILVASPAIAGPGAAIVVTTAPVVRQASDSGSCYAIGDSDQRNFCLAKARKEPSACYSIQRPDLRAMCLAEVRR